MSSVLLILSWLMLPQVQSCTLPEWGAEALISKIFSLFLKAGGYYFPLLIQWFSIFLRLRPFNGVPHVVVIPNHKTIFVAIS